MQIFKAEQIGRNILLKSISHIGEREATGNNDGPAVERYLRFVGIDPALPAAEKPWCAAAASAWTYWTLVSMGIDHTTSFVKTASSHEAVDWGIRHHTIITDPALMLPGDWCILKGGEGTPAQNGVPYHHTTVLEFVKDGQVHWVAGNDGNMVRRGPNPLPLSAVTVFRPYVLTA